MRNLLKFTLALFLLGSVSACNLSKTAVVRDTVKSVATTTPDFYSFYVAEIGEGKLKDWNHTIAQNLDQPDLIIRLIPATDKQDLGYFIIKPAGAGTSTTYAPEGPVTGEITVPLGLLRQILIPQRGN